MPTKKDVIDVDGDDDGEEEQVIKVHHKKAESKNKKPKIDELLEGLDEEEAELDGVGKAKAKPKQSVKGKPAKSKAKHDDEESEDLEESESEDDDEDEKPKSKKKTVTTRKGTKIEYEGKGEVPKTKKEATAAKKAQQANSEGVMTATGLVPNDDPLVIKYKKMTISQLKDWLRANEMLMSGVKDELVARCVDGEKNGRLPKCERCRQGKLSFNADRGVYTCSGYFDTDANMMIRCSFAEPTVPRLAWTDPETAAANKEASLSASTGASSSSAADHNLSGGGDLMGKVTDEFVDSLTPLAMKEVAERLVKFCRDDLQLQVPTDDKAARLKIGPILISNRDTDGKPDVRKVIAELIKVFPPAPVESSSGEASSVQKPTSGASSKVPANEAIASLLDQMAVLEKKRGGENVQFKIVALKKAAIAIRGLDFEITDGVALGKPGKTKVEGIGKATAKNIQEYLDSGKTSSPYLEYLKKEVGEA